MALLCQWYKSEIHHTKKGRNISNRLPGLFDNHLDH